MGDKGIWKLVGVVLVVVGVMGVSGCGEKETLNSSTNVDNYTLPTTGDKSPTFRNTTWGMSKEEVLKVENAELGTQDDNTLLYAYKIDGLDSFLFYNFIDDKLFKSGYMINIERTNPTDFITDYKKLKDGLLKKYGQPTSDEEVWKDDQYKDRPNEWGMAVLTGDLIYKAIWGTEDTAIMIMLQGDNFEETLAIAYESKEFGEVNEKRENESTQDDL